MASRTPTAATAFEKALAYVTIALGVMVFAALFRGRAHWEQIPAEVWVHIASLSLVLVLTPILLLRRRGDARHRLLGWIWAVAMMVTAVDSLQVRVIIPGHFSPIHILSVITIITVPLLVWRARMHQIAAHRRSVRIIVTLAILVAGFSTFPFNRLLGRWLFGG